METETLLEQEAQARLEFGLKMDHHETAELLIHLLRRRELLEVAVDKMLPGAFQQDFPDLELVWKAAYENAKQFGPRVVDSPKWLSRLESSIRRLLDPDDYDAFEYEQGLLGTEELDRKKVDIKDFEEESEDEEDRDEEDEEVTDSDDTEEDATGKDESAAGDEEIEYEDILRSDRCFLAKVFDMPFAKLDRKRGQALLQRCLMEKYWGRLASDIVESSNIGRVPADPDAFAAEFQRRAMEISGLTAPTVGTVGEQWKEHEAQLDKYRGRHFVGLQTGLAVLDERTLGLRGVGTLGSPPNLGKTALALEIAIGVCRHHEQNDVVVVFAALDMPKKDLISRIKCNLAGMEASVLLRGSSDKGEYLGSFNKADRKKLKTAKRRMAEEEIGRRLLILDRQDLGEYTSAEKLVAILQDLKTRVGARRGLLILDYLQILPVPPSLGKRPEMEQDRYRIRVMQDVVELTRTEDNPNGDAVLFISEARKPPNAKEQWGGSLSEFMGTARLTYAVDFALLFKRMSDSEIHEWFGVDKDAVKGLRETLDHQGIAPMMLSLEKARDGMTKGKWGIRYFFRTSRLQEIETIPSHGEVVGPTGVLEMVELMDGKESAMLAKMADCRDVQHKGTTVGHGHNKKGRRRRVKP